MKLVIHKGGERIEYELADRADVRVSFEPPLDLSGAVGLHDFGARSEVILTCEQGAHVELEGYPALPAQGVFKTRKLEAFPLGKHVEYGSPPRVMLEIPDSTPEPEPPKPKRKTKGAA